MRAWLLIVAVLSSSMALPARADRLDDDLTTVWESVWDQRGTPGRLTRWEQPVRFRISGTDANRHHDFVAAAVTEAGHAAGLTVHELAQPSDGTAANLEIELVGERQLDDHTPCLTQLNSVSFALSHARIRMRSDVVWECTYHEVMHAMGIAGHPSGKTVLSYFPWRRDVFMEMDKLLLAAWYDRTLSRGATPFDVLWVAGERVARQEGLGLSADEAEKRRRAHFAERMGEMERFAQGQDDAPMIIKRSGRASPGHIEEGRTLMAYYLGFAHQRAAAGYQDDAKSAAWFRHAATRAHAPSQVMLARALLAGAGVVGDPVEAHRWLASAQRGGNTVARTELQRLEKSMDTALLEKARALGPY